MGTISDYLEIKWLDHVFQNGAFGVPLCECGCGELVAKEGIIVPHINIKDV